MRHKVIKVKTKRSCPKTFQSLLGHVMTRVSLINQNNKRNTTADIDTNSTTRHMTQIKKLSRGFVNLEEAIQEREREMVGWWRKTYWINHFRENDIHAKILFTILFVLNLLLRPNSMIILTLICVLHYYAYYIA